MVLGYCQHQWQKFTPSASSFFGALEEKKKRKKRLLGTVNLVGKLTSVAFFHLVL